MSYLLLLVGFILLVKGADYLIDGGIELSTLSGVSPLFIGLAVTSIGTSAPEAAVSIRAAIISHPNISFGNILGSNMANIGLVLGLAALLYTLPARDSTIKKELPFSLFITFVLLLLLRDDWFFKGIPSLSRIDGAILLGFFSLFLFYLYRMALSDRKKLLIEKNISHIEYSKRELLKASLITIIGITGIILGGHLVVNNAIIIARSLGVSETLISVTIVALGTSLPEMVTSLMAVKKNKWDIAIGNVVGSNIFNILFVLGLSSIIRPIQFSTIAFPDLLIVIGISIILLPFIHTRHRLSRKEGGVLLLIYIAYIVFAVLRR